MEGYGAKNVDKITGISRVRLFQWIEKGFVTPSIMVASGTGSRNIFSREDLYRIELVKRLSGSGMTLDVASTICSEMQIGDFIKKSSLDKQLLVFKEFEGDTYTSQEMPIPKTDRPKGKHSDPMLDHFEQRFSPLQEVIADHFSGGYDIAFIVNIRKVVNDVDRKINKFAK